MVIVVLCYQHTICLIVFFFFQAEDGIRDPLVTGVQTCALPIWAGDGAGRDGLRRPGRRGPEQSAAAGASGVCDVYVGVDGGAEGSYCQPPQCGGVAGCGAGAVRVWRGGGVGLVPFVLV